ncbi:MAG: hypothetical protein QNJ20_07835 [Paracoccaceae bacterium]|nr:hypothetical protein [Paracoccaceae bacterium]
MSWTLSFIMEAMPVLAAIFLLLYIGITRYGLSTFQRFLVAMGVKQSMLAKEIDEWIEQNGEMSLEENQESLKYFNERLRDEVHQSIEAAALQDPTKRVGLRSAGRSLFDGVAFAAGVAAILLQGPEVIGLFTSSASGGGF